ncbi:MAG TPA: DUF6049 family protein [Actinomycetota bacterium]
MTRRLLAGLIMLLLGLFWMVSVTRQANAQDQPSVTMTLLSQTAWTGQRRPLDLSFQATNNSAMDLKSLTVELLVLAPARSRSLYELSIRSDPTPVIAAYPFPQEGTLEPGQSRAFRVRQGMGQIAQRGESALYPLRVELRSQDVPVGVLRTPTVFLIERPEVPLNLAWTWVLSEPLQYHPNGIFQPGTIEADIAPGGRLDALVEALSGIRNRAVDLVVSPTLLDQLRRMAGGYRIAAQGGARTVPKGTGGAAAAQRMLARLQEVASRPGVELVAYPMGDPSLPALLRAGMDRDLDRLLEEGRQLVASVLGRPVASDVARPPGSALDPLTLQKLASLGARTTPVDPSFLTFPKFAAPPTARLTSGASSLTAVLPDPEVQGFIRSNAADPRLAAQLALGELAAIWFELPGTPGRGAAVMFPEKLAAAPRFHPAFVSLIRSSPWLHQLTASAFASSVPPQVRRQVPVRNYPSFSPLYVDRLERAKISLAHFNKAIHGGEPLIERLRHNLLLADSGAFLADSTLGQQFIGSVDSTARRVYDRLGIGTSVVTLTSRAGFIPVTLENASGYTVTVVLQFISDRRLEFAGGASRVVELPPNDKTLTIGVKSLANGRIPIRVRLVTPGASFPEVIVERGLVVRSTAYNRLALFVTIGAALFLLAWWGRRFLPRRRT